MSDRPRWDWRGWVTLAWVIFWGACYCNMAVRERGGRVLDWFKPQQHARAPEAPAGAIGAKAQTPAIATVIGPVARE
jgi:hypothetical protein